MVLENENANKLAKKGTPNLLSGPDPASGINKSVARSSLRRWIE